MAITEEFNVTETLDTTEWSFFTDTAGPDVEASDGVRQAKADLSAMAAGDTFAFYVYDAVASGGTQRVCRTFTFTGVQADPIFVFPPDIFGHKCDITGKKLAGTARSITLVTWKVA